ncbi:MAG: AsmA-like C-terminal region-containing protein, partial [Sphingomonadaceae bacterium]
GSGPAARYGEVLALRARLPTGEPPWLSVRLGGSDDADAPRLPGLVLGGVLDRLDLDAWRAVVPAEAAGRGAAGPAWLREADLRLGELRVQQRRLPDTRLRVRPADQGWRINLEGAHASGEIVTLPGAGGTRVSANFKHLRLPEAEPDGAAGAAREQMPAEDLAGLELNVASLHWKNFGLGELRLRLTPEARGLRVDQMTLKTPEALLEGKGLLANHRRRPTRLDLRLDGTDLGKLLARFGYPDSVRQAATRVTGHLAWMGGVEDFAFATLDGELDLHVGKGQFLKVDPGAARLLGIVSLQALPRRIALDFRDVFSEGFAFDEIDGALYLQRGKAYTKDLRMNGPAARVRMSGVIDLDRETQNLRLAIQPRLDDTMALAGALLGGPAVGIGALIAGKVLQDPIGQAATFEYTLSGTWSDPVVAKVPRARQDAPPAP